MRRLSSERSTAPTKPSFARHSVAVLQNGRSSLSSPLETVVVSTCGSSTIVTSSGAAASFDINRSGTRKEELLLHPDEVERVRTLRRVLADMHPAEAMELLTSRIRKTKTNAEFLFSMNMA